MIIGLTGGIASGKTTVSNILMGLGAEIVDADRIAHQILKKGRKGWEEVLNEFGPRVLTEEEEIDRSYLGQIVFHNSEKRRKLEEITHPLIIDQIKKEIKKGEKNQKPVFLDAPLLFETELDKLVDQVWVVYVDRATQFQRLMKRDKLSKEEAGVRIDSQLPLGEKRKMADLVIDNRGGRRGLKKKVIKYWKELRK